jgi:hypothetical protein
MGMVKSREISYPYTAIAVFQFGFIPVLDIIDGLISI